MDPKPIDPGTLNEINEIIKNAKDPQLQEGANKKGDPLAKYKAGQFSNIEGSQGDIDLNTLKIAEAKLHASQVQRGMAAKNAAELKKANEANLLRRTKSNVDDTYRNK